MSISDGNSTTRPLRQRKSKRFDRSGGSPLPTGSTVLDDDLDVDLPEQPLETVPAGDTTAAAEPEIDTIDQAEPVTVGDGPDSSGSAEPAAPVEGTTVSASGGESDSLLADPTARSRTLDQLGSCGRCGHEVSTVNIAVDGNVLLMESCDNCDTRRWQLAGEAIELQQALDHVGEHTGRRR